MGPVELDALGALVWKELLDLWRDKKTLFTTALLPLVAMPLIGLATYLLSSQQPVSVAIVNEDAGPWTGGPLNLTVDPGWLVGNLTSALEAAGCRVSVFRGAAPPEAAYDLLVLIPRGFSRNATSASEQARVEIVRKANVQPAASAEAIVRAVVARFSLNLSIAKVEALASLAGLPPGSYSAPALLEPVVAGATLLVTPSGAPASPLEQFKPFLAKVLILGLIFVVTPASIVVVDGIAGERERKTIEMLLAAPLGLDTVIAGKLIAATALGFLSSLADVAGLLLYMHFLALAFGGYLWLALDPKLIAIHAAVSFLTIMVSVAASIPFVTRAKGVRSASSVSTVVTTVATVMFFTGFMVDYPKLEPGVLYPLYAVPFTHSILAIQRYVYGDPLGSALHMLALALASAALLYAGVKTLNPEKVLLA